MNDAFERRDSLRRYASVTVTTDVPTGAPGSNVVQTKGVVSLKGIFVEGGEALRDWGAGDVDVEVDLGGAAPFRATCALEAARAGGRMLTWKDLGFERERELARYLDEGKR